MVHGYQFILFHSLVVPVEPSHHSVIAADKADDEDDDEAKMQK
jgi:hypothetical protein